MSDTQAPEAIVERQGHIMILTLNRPEKRNALSPDMLVRCYRAWREFDEDDELRCAILTGAGGTFCSGADLTAMMTTLTEGNLSEGGTSGDAAAGELVTMMKEVPDLHWQALLRHNRPMKPIIAAVEGFALAGGTEILQGTDIRVASETAVFGVTEAMRGLFPLGGSSIRLRRQIPYTLAAEMLLTARRVSAREALNFGLVGHVVPEGKALEKALEIARTVADNGPLSIKALMRCLREYDGSYLEAEALERELEVGWPVFQSEDTREGLAAFAEKRKPNYRGK